MRVAFINSTFERGKDGPGDYTRTLAGELQRRGWECGLFSFADRISESYCYEIQDGIPTHRYSKRLKWDDRIRLLRSSLQNFNPDVMSLGVVSYAMNSKGIVWGLAEKFSKLNTSKVPWHLMYQEIWIGAHREASIKDRLVGWLQKYGLVRFHSALRPQWVNCWNKVHRECLNAAGIHSDVLPVMSAIPVGVPQTGDQFWKWIQENSKIKRPRRDVWLIGFFGTLHPQWPSEPLFTKLHAIASSMGKEIVMTALGDLRSGKDLWSELSLENRSRFVMISRGELSSEEVSACIQELDFGIATTPWQILGKSSTAAAFLENGIPTIVNREESYGFSSEIEDFDHPLAIRMDASFERKISEAQRGQKKSSLPLIADQFMKMLMAGSPLHDRSE